MSELQGYLPGYSSSTGIGAGLSTAPAGRQLQQYVSNGINLSSIVCPPESNSSSIFKPLSFEDQKGAATFFLIAVTLYMFLGLAIVCDSFFESALSAICEHQGLKDDVAGATWMAAGGSAPEFATSTIGVFFSFSDVGFGTIVGSAVFNVLFVIACCAFVSTEPLHLSWWPLARDCSYYCFALAALVIFVSDLKVEHYEAIILFLMYCGYVTVMYFNEWLERNVKIWVEANEKRQGIGLRKMMITVFENKIFAAFLYAVILANSIVVIMELGEFQRRSDDLPCVCDVALGAATLPYSTLYYVNLAFNIFFIAEMAFKFYAYGFYGYWKVPLNAFDGSLVFLIIVEFILTENARNAASSSDDPTAEANDQIGVGAARTLRLLKFVRFIRTLRLFRAIRVGVDAHESERTNADTGDVNAETPKTDPHGKTRVGGEGDANGVSKPPPAEAPPADADEEEDDDDGPFDPFEVPESMVGKAFWVVGLPLSIAFWLTIPDCRREMFGGRWYLVTFSNCIIWIAILSGIMVWMVERIGKIYGVPDSIMGVFVLAAGTSIPDCLSSVAVARRGHGDMAVSSSIGSNIFDVLIGLPIPWIIYTCIARPALGPEWQPTLYVPINSESLAFMILLLFVMVALVVTVIHLSGWILSQRLGLAMMGLYFVFLVIALLVDRKVFFGDCDWNLDQFTVTGR